MAEHTQEIVERVSREITKQHLLAGQTRLTGLYAPETIDLWVQDHWRGNKYLAHAALDASHHHDLQEALEACRPEIEGDLKCIIECNTLCDENLKPRLETLDPDAKEEVDRRQAILTKLDDALAKSRGQT